MSMTPKSYELTDSMLASIKGNVKENHPWLLNNLADPSEIIASTDQPDIIPNPNHPNKEIAQINKAYTKLANAANKGELTDSFRETLYTETQSRTERSCKETVARYLRYYSILQASN